MFIDVIKIGRINYKFFMLALQAIIVPDKKDGLN